MHKVVTALTQQYLQFCSNPRIEYDAVTYSVVNVEACLSSGTDNFAASAERHFADYKEDQFSALYSPQI